LCAGLTDGYSTLMADINPYAPPTTDVADFPSDHQGGDTLHPPPTGLAHAATFALGACALLKVAGVWTGVKQLELLGRAPFISEAEAEANDTMVATAVLAYVAVALTTAIIFGFWLVRANRTARSLAPGSVQISPGWSVGWFFVPVANLWKPYQAVTEVWFASEMYDPNRVVERPWFFPLWWAAWIGGTVLSRLAGSAMKSAGSDIGELIDATYLSIADDVAWLVAALLAILVVRSIAGAQEKGWRARA
jgi:hypothetical protein